MTRHSKTSFTRRDLLRSVSVAVLIIAAAYLFLQTVPSQHYAVSEARFSDRTDSGLVVVPASGASETSYQPGVCPNGLNRTLYPACVCPAGYVQVGSICINHPTCQNGLDQRFYPDCRCPAGQTQVGNSCVENRCPNGLNATLYPSCVCPEGQVQVGDRCETSRRPDDPFPPGQSSYPPVTTSYTTSYAPNSCWDGSDPNPISGACPSCPPEYTRVGNSCVPTDSNPHFIGFPTTRGFNASGHLEVRPGLVRSGDVTYVYWNVSNVRDCTVRGTNGDGAPGSLTGTWNSLGSGAAGKTTSPITSRTDYTLFCRSLIGATPSTVTETRSVNVIPSWYEPKGEQ